MPLTLRCKQCAHKTVGTYADKCFKCGAVDWERDHSDDSRAELSPSGFRVLLGILLFLVVVFVAFSGEIDKWNFAELEESSWIHHDKMTTVFMKDWVNGEYKQCASFNESKNEPILVCGDEKGEGKLFKVRFYGRTYRPELKPDVQFKWACKRNDDSDPMFVCERQSSAK